LLKIATLLEPVGLSGFEYRDVSLSGGASADYGRPSVAKSSQITKDRFAQKRSVGHSIWDGETTRHKYARDRKTA
jgi:hypothetical protein